MKQCWLLLGPTLISLGLQASAASTPSSLADATAQTMNFVTEIKGDDFRKQWSWIDPRMRYWVKPDRWRLGMRKTRSEFGRLVEARVIQSGLVTADQIPCTEMGHCFRTSVQYAVFIVRTRYSAKQVPQPEYIVMSWSSEGWRFAGGSFPARPLGETAVLLDEADDARFRAMQRSLGR